MEFIIESFEEQVETILKEIRVGLTTVFSSSIADEIVSLLDDGLTIDYNDPKVCFFQLITMLITMPMGI